jgi:hypothetical protein
VGVLESFSSKQGRRGEGGRLGRRGAMTMVGGVRPGRWRDGHALGSASPGGFPLGCHEGVMMASSGVQPTSRGSGRQGAGGARWRGPEHDVAGSI